MQCNVKPIIKKKSTPGYRDKDIHSQAKQGKSVREKRVIHSKLLRLKYESNES